ncbi:MAG: transposase [Synechococcaceae cyanobacterium ELA263]
MTNPTKTRRRFTEQQKLEAAVALCMQEGLSCNVVAHRLGLPSSSLDEAAFQEHRGCYGSPRIHQELLQGQQRSRWGGENLARGVNRNISRRFDRR